MTSDNSPTAFLKERLRLSAIPYEAAKYAGIRPMSVNDARKAGYSLPNYAADGFLLPYYGADGKLIKQMWRWRSNPDARRGFARLPEQTRYAQPTGTGCWAYFPRVKGLCWLKLLANPKVPAFVVEGELKALSLTCAGVPAVALGGVWNYLGHKALLPELKQLAEGGRTIGIAFDSDTENKTDVKRARYNLAKMLLDERADVHWLTLPHFPDLSKTGVDDLVRIWKEKNDELGKRLMALEPPEPFAIQQHFYRMNAQYVLNIRDACIYETADPARNWNDLTFARVIENEQVVVGQKTGKGEKLEDVIGKLGRAWIDWPGRNAVTGRVYEPRGQDDEPSPYVTLHGQRYLNNWTGWASRPEPDPEGIAKYWTRLLDHLFQPQSHEAERQRSERERARRWIEMWFAYPIQNPGAKLYSSVVMLGAQGGGKTLLGNMVGWACYDPHFTEITQDQLETRFNASWASNTSFVMGSEVTNDSDRQQRRKVSEVLKNWITQEMIKVEEKHEKGYEVKNVINLYFTANQPSAFFMEGDDRRFFLYQIPDVKLADALGRPWLREMDAYIRSPKGKAALHYHLLHEVEIDSKLFDPMGAPPDTEAKRNAKQYSQNTAEFWLDSFLEEPAEFEGFARGQRVFQFKEVRNAFLKATNSDERSWPEQTFLKVFRTRFRCLARRTVDVLKTKRYDREKQAFRPEFERMKIGLWVKKAGYTNGGAGHLHISEAVTIWNEELTARCTQ